MVAYSTPGNQYNLYKQQSAMTASPGELTLMLYDGCIKALKLARTYIEEKDFVKSNEASQKAQAIIAELMRTLDTRYEVGKQLLALYDFVLNLIVSSNIKKNAGMVDQALEFVTGLRDTWQQAVRINRQQVFGKGSSV